MQAAVKWGHDRKMGLVVKQNDNLGSVVQDV